MQTSMNTRQQPGNRNAHLIGGGKDSTLCALWLNSLGIAIERITVGLHPQPAIEIQVCSACAGLKRNHGGHQYGWRDGKSLWKAEIMGCRVEWTERGH